MSGSVAAFFDLDGTLLPEPSLEQRLFSALRKARAIPYRNYLLWLGEALRLLPSGLLPVQYSNKRYLSGLNVDLALQHFDSLVFFEEGTGRVAWHARQGHQIVLVSGTLRPLAELAAMSLECELEARGLPIHVQILATEVAESRGNWTGQLIGRALYGPGKASAVVALAQTRQWNLAECHAYGNATLDCAFLCVAGHGHAVNPGEELAAIANRKDWPIWHWHQEKRLIPRTDSSCVSGIQSVKGPG